MIVICFLFQVANNLVYSESRSMREGIMIIIERDEQDEEHRPW